jgi:hypothetical protein
VLRFKLKRRRVEFMPYQKIPNTDLTYALITFDSDGHERTDDTEGGIFSKTLLARVRETQPTHVFLFSHGWEGDVPAAVDQYNRWIGAMWNLTADRADMGSDFKPVFIGLHWPSRPWGEEVVPASAASFGTATDLSINTLLDAAAEHFGGGPGVRAPLAVIFQAFEKDPAAREVPDHVVAAYHELAKAIGFDAHADSGASPDDDGAPLDPQAAVRAEQLANTGQSFGIGGSIKNGILAGLRQASFWLMKHRARTVGEQGMHQFISQLQQVSNADVHLMGHSFGCIVVSSILGGPEGKGSLTRPVSSAALVQGALSLWSFADRLPDRPGPGYFQDVITKGSVSGPIVTTQSTNDLAVGLAYPAAVGLVDEVDFGTELPKFGGVGTWGIQGTTSATAGLMLDEKGRYDFQPKQIYNLNGSQFIPSHIGIDGPQVAHALWQVALAGSRVRA